MRTYLTSSLGLVYWWNTYIGWGNSNSTPAYAYSKWTSGYKWSQRTFCAQTFGNRFCIFLIRPSPQALHPPISYYYELNWLSQVLALKFYRNLASKLASIFFALNGNCIACFRAADENELNANCQQTMALIAGSMVAENTNTTIQTADATSPPSLSSASSLNHLPTPMPVAFDGTRRFSAAALEFFHGTRKRRMRLMNSAHLSYRGA